MQKQYGNNPQFKDWYKLKVKEIESDSGLKFIRDMRNTYLKEQIAKTDVSESTYIATYELRNGIYTLKERADLSSPEVEFEGLFFSISKSGKSVDEFCSTQLKKLECMVEECEDKFLK